MDRPADSDVNFLIGLSNTCESFHCLPKPGGLYDQDAVLVIGMQFVRNAQGEKDKRDNDKRIAEAKSKSKTKKS